MDLLSPKSWRFCRIYVTEVGNTYERLEGDVVLDFGETAMVEFRIAQYVVWEEFPKSSLKLLQ